jgi:hypothetical protein
MLGMCYSNYPFMFAVEMESFHGAMRGATDLPITCQTPSRIPTANFFIAMFPLLYEVEAQLTSHQINN